MIDVFFVKEHGRIWFVQVHYDSSEVWVYPCKHELIGETFAGFEMKAFGIVSDHHVIIDPLVFENNCSEYGVKILFNETQDPQSVVVLITV